MDVVGHHFLRPQNTTSRYLRIVATSGMSHANARVMQIFINLTNKRLVRTKKALRLVAMIFNENSNRTAISAVIDSMLLDTISLSTLLHSVCISQNYCTFGMPRAMSNKNLYKRIK